MKLTKAEARRFILTYQNLLLAGEVHGKTGVMRYMQRVRSIQFDPLNMVGYNPYLVLQSRIKDFRPEFLEELLYSDRKLVDGWDKNMCIYCVEDWPYFERYRNKAYQMYTAKSEIMQALPAIRKAIAARGPLSSQDLSFDTKIRWPWGPTRVSRAALESMYFWGELVIHHKLGTRKIYDFAAKHLPSEILSMDDPNVTLDQFFQWVVKRRISSVGLLWNRSSDAWLGIEQFKSKERNQAVERLKQRGEIIELEIEDIKYPCYILREEEELLDKILEKKDVEFKVSFIAPLDNLLWDRKLIKELFGFEYVWEVYKPVVDRQYGYYVLPVLYGDRFIARFEPKFNKQNQTLEILNWWWEPNIVIAEDIRWKVQECLDCFMGYLGAENLSIAKGDL